MGTNHSFGLKSIIVFHRQWAYVAYVLDLYTVLTFVRFIASISPMGGLKANSKNHTDHKTHREKSTKERSIHRFKIAKGHIDSIITQIENDEYCLDIVH